MAYVVIATWRAREGEEAAVREILRALTPLTLSEPACRMYIAQQDRADPRSFVIYEQYDDEAGLEAHRESEHFKRHVLGDAVNRLDERFAKFYEIVD